VVLEAGQDVLVLGATGSAGRLAVQVARLLGAGRVIAAGRDPDRLAALPRLGATSTVRLDADDLAGAAADVDVVLDYLWGEPAAAAMAALITARRDRSRPLVWVAIGSVAGLAAPIPSAALRAARLQIVGSGQGSVGTREIVAELPALADAIAGGRLEAEAEAVPLSDVTQAWDHASDRRTVLVPRD
ncbi:MAG TPA: zinc-binding dehydrogenase, partial [Cellulomonas sp.]